MKPYFCRAQALIELRRPEAALEAAQIAYRICLTNKDNSSGSISQFILRTKQALWQGKETTRLRALDGTLKVVEEALEQQLRKDLDDLDSRFARQEIGEVGRDEEKASLRTEAADHRSNVRAMFKDPARAETAERVMPDYLVDGITFEIMQDPVITPSGVSYERSSLLRHLKSSPVDPLTRVPMTEQQLIPNIALKNACEEFLAANGWAVDY